jgi:pimeloyl-ACP methyl ester carboxylesterase
MKSTRPMTLAGLAAALGLIALALPVLASPTRPISTKIMNAKTNIVLVHGAFADANCWAKVIPALEKNGYNVVAVQNPLTSYADDVASTKRVIDAQKGPTIVVGHSYGGAVITGAANDCPNVKALVYVAAFAPDEGEVIGGLLEKYPSPLGGALVPDAAGFLYIDRAKFKDVFAGDVNESERIVMETTQKPVNSQIFGQKFGKPAWKSYPTWYMIATEDRAINPDLERLFAKRMNAKVEEIKASHVPFMSKPSEVIKIIEAAAKASVK